MCISNKQNPTFVGQNLSLCTSNMLFTTLSSRIMPTKSHKAWWIFQQTTVLTEISEQMDISANYRSNRNKPTSNYKDRVAQWIRRLTTNQEIEGSNPFVVGLECNCQSSLRRNATWHLLVQLTGLPQKCTFNYRERCGCFRSLSSANRITLFYSAQSIIPAFLLLPLNINTLD